ncbi:hypothetical protein [Acinetobacter venetianus]|nr:hypothetical protein [Acinetobacter venetianus]
MTGKLELVGGNNMAAVHLSDAVGGDLFMGFISAVAFRDDPCRCCWF